MKKRLTKANIITGDVECGFSQTKRKSIKKKGSPSYKWLKLIGASIIGVLMWKFYSHSRRMADTDFDDLVNWIKENDGVVDGIELFLNSFGIRGLRTTKAFNNGDIIMKIPFSCTIWNNATFDASGQRIFSSPLLEEIPLKEKSKYWHYLKSLPSMEDFRSFMPATANEEVRADFEPIMSFNPSLNCENQCSDLEIRSWLLIKTRNFGCYKKSYYGKTLIPIADLMNTKRGDLNTRWEFDEAHNFVVTAISNIEPGEELYDMYNKYSSNDYVFRVWGFLFENNEFPVQNWEKKEKEKCEKLALAKEKYKESNLPMINNLIKLAKEHCPSML